MIQIRRYKLLDCSVYCKRYSTLFDCHISYNENCEFFVARNTFKLVDNMHLTLAEGDVDGPNQKIQAIGLLCVLQGIVPCLIAIYPKMRTVNFL